MAEKNLNLGIGAILSLNFLEQWEKNHALRIEVTPQLVLEAREWVAEHFGHQEVDKLSKIKVVQKYLDS